MSFIILLLIVFLLYAALSTYRSLYRVALIASIMAGATLAFIIRGYSAIADGGIFNLLDTRMNFTVFLHVSAVWIAVDIAVLIKMIRNYRYYLHINGKSVSIPEQGQA